MAKIVILEVGIARHTATAYLQRALGKKTQNHRSLSDQHLPLDTFLFYACGNTDFTNVSQMVLFKIRVLSVT